MAAQRVTPATVDEYMESFGPEIRLILQKVRQCIRKAAPGAQETISYGMPAFKLKRILVYFSAFKNHIGLFPPVSGDPRIEKEIAPYAGPKGNLQFPLKQPIPYGLIERIVKLRVKQDALRR